MNKLVYKTAIMALCLVCIFTLTAGCININLGGTGANTQTTVPTVTIAQSTIAQGTQGTSAPVQTNQAYTAPYITHDLEGSTILADGTTVKYEIETDDDLAYNMVELTKETKHNFNENKLKLSGTVTMSGTDYVITLLNGDVYSLSQSYLLTTPEGQTVQMYRD